MSEPFQAAKIIPYEFSTRKSDEALKTISEVASGLGVQTYVIRFWEKKFPEISPLLRSGGRRYYAKETVELLHRIKGYLYDEGYTIRGVQQLLKENKTRRRETPEEKDKGSEALKGELKSLRNFLKGVLKKPAA